MWLSGVVRFGVSCREGSNFRSNFSGREYSMSSRFTCNSSGVVNVIRCKVCGKQYVGSTFAPLRVRLNNYTSSSKKFSSGISGKQVERLNISQRLIIMEFQRMSVFRF